jgi:hypothetical protein
MSKQIHNALFSRPHNKHYLTRYYKFIVTLIDQDVKSHYTESHHICPKSKDLFPEFANLKINPWNKIKLTARQHFIAHWLLWKSYGGGQRYAFLAMVRGVKNKYQQDRTSKINSKTYKILKEEHYKSSKGENNYFFHHKFIGQENGFYGKKHSEETKKIISRCQTGKIESDETRRLKSLSHIGLEHSNKTIQLMKSLKWFYDPVTGNQIKSIDCPVGYLPGRKLKVITTLKGKPKSAETKAKMSEAARRRYNKL